MALNTSALSSKKTSKKAEKPEFTPSSPELVDRLAELLNEREVLETSLEFAKSRIRAEGFEFWLYQDNAVKSLLVHGVKQDLTLTFRDDWRSDAKPRKDNIVTVLGKLGYDEFFAEKTTISIDLSELPDESQQQVVFDEVAAVLAKHGVANAASATTKAAPVKNFNALRRLKLTVEQNLALDAILTTPSAIARVEEKAPTAA